jgi:hypothetical protein
MFKCGIMLMFQRSLAFHNVTFKRKINNLVTVKILNILLRDVGSGPTLFYA